MCVVHGDRCNNDLPPDPSVGVLAEMLHPDPSVGVLAEMLHPDPSMDLATYAAVWDARSHALALVAQALTNE